MKLPFGKERPLIIVIATILLLTSAIYPLWRGTQIIVIKPIDQGLIGLGNLWRLLDLIIGILYLSAAYFLFKIDSLESGIGIALLLGLTLTAYFSSTEGISLPFILEGILPLIAGLISLREQKPVRRQLWIRRIKNFWLDFSHNKIGLVGLAIILLYVGMAVFQPFLITYDPEARTPAQKYALPEWMSLIDPTYKNSPRTIFNRLEWKWDSAYNTLIQRNGSTITIKYDENENIVIPLYTQFSYLWNPPTTFSFTFSWNAALKFTNGSATARYSLELNFTTPDGKTYPLWDQHWQRYRTALCRLKNPYEGPTYYPGGKDYNKYGYSIYEKYGWQIPVWETNMSLTTVSIPTGQDTNIRLGYAAYESHKLVEDIFTPPGDNYTFKMYLTIKPIQPDAFCEISLTDIKVHIPGVLWGILGTEHWGRDIWSRLIAGARVSLAVGLAAAVISTLLGVVVGLTSGYYGGIIDEILMRIVDILLCLPVLPLLMVLIYFWGRNILYVIFLIAIFGWLGLARVIRSQVLSLKEMPFIECAKASGASGVYIMFKHLLPNVMPVVMTDFILTIPGAILTEAALSFIGFGDPSTPTWGREYSFMQSVGSVSTIIKKWWWSLPPGLMITILCVGFVFLGHAIDEIINPRLRRRR